MADEKIKLRSQKKANVLMKKDSSLERLPIVRQFQHTKPPLLKEVFGRVYEKIDTDKMNFKDAVHEMAKEIQKHWKDRNVYTIGLKHIISKLSKHVNGYKQLQKRNPSIPHNCLATLLTLQNMML